MQRVGIITMPPNDVPGAASYIPLSVINWFRDAGIQVVPISYRLRPRDVPAVLQHVNGLFLQGGPSYVKSYMRLVSHFLKAARAANAAGDHFPVWGTCHGFQLILKEFGAPWPLTSVDSMVWSAPLHLREVGRMHIPASAIASAAAVIATATSEPPRSRTVQKTSKTNFGKVSTCTTASRAVCTVALSSLCTRF